MTYTRQFLANLLMVFLLLCMSGYYMCFYYAATAHGEFINFFDHLAFAVWVWVWFISVATGIEVLKDANQHYDEEWIQSQIPPLFPEGAI